MRLLPFEAPLHHAPQGEELSGRFHLFANLFVDKLDEKTQLPAHGKGRELGKGLIHSIKKQLGLK
jgi:hypothetical protein